MNTNEILNMVYDLIAQNPIKGCYDHTHDDLTALVDCVNIGAGEIEFITSPWRPGHNQEGFTLRLIKSHCPNPPAV